MGGGGAFEVNTPGTTDGPGCHDQTLVIKNRKPPKKASVTFKKKLSIFLYISSSWVKI